MTREPFRPGLVYRLLAEDHARLDALLDKATGHPGPVDAEVYAEFRARLLRHIAMEEKILLPAAQGAQGGKPLPIAARLRLDHGAIAALLVPSPSAVVIAALHDILARHNRLEEGHDGVYATCERLVGGAIPELLAALRAAPAVPASPHVDGPRIMEALCRALERAGYRLADYEGEPR